jgi:transposase
LNTVFLEWMKRPQKCVQVDGEYVGWTKRTQYIEIDFNREIRLCYTWRGAPYNICESRRGVKFHVLKGVNPHAKSCLALGRFQIMIAEISGLSSIFAEKDRGMKSGRSSNSASLFRFFFRRCDWACCSAKIIICLWFVRYWPYRRSAFHSIYQRVISIDAWLFRSGRRHFSRPEFLGHWKVPGPNNQDVGEKRKRTADRRPRKLRIDGVSKLMIVRVRGLVLKNRSGVIRVLNEAIEKSWEISMSWSKLDRTSEYDT